MLNTTIVFAEFDESSVEGNPRQKHSGTLYQYESVRSTLRLSHWDHSQIPIFDVHSMIAEALLAPRTLLSILRRN
jgi:hypothetical protein